MTSDTKRLDAASVVRLNSIIERAGGERCVAKKMAVADGKNEPTKEEIAAQAKRLRRILKGGTATMKSLTLISSATGKPLPDFLSDVIESSAILDSTNTTHDVNDPSHDLRLADTNIGQAYRRLARASQITESRTNLVRNDSGQPVLTLGDHLYVEREIEEDIARAVEDRRSDTSLVIVDGEAGTGKSSVIWATLRTLKKHNLDVWLVDASELPNILGQGDDGIVLSESYRELFRSMAADERSPVLLIDTIDVPLNRSGADVQILSLITELTLSGVTLVAACRPGEARMLSAHNPVTIKLFDYSDKEFVRAVVAYARAYVGYSEPLDAETHAERVLEAAAQGYPIKELCRNPLTLRMLYDIYAPQDINLQDVDVVALYREYWRRRVESDGRTASSTPGLDKIDLSDAAMRIAIAMLVSGSPEVPKDRLARELRSAGLSQEDLQRLESRGVIRVSRLAPDHLVGFFHQTFFEHAAALAIARLGPKAVAALAERWTANGGNLFLTAILERLLVLSEYELLPTQREAERFMESLDGPSGKTIAVYVFVHRRSIPAHVTHNIFSWTTQHDPLAVERLLAIGANAARARRLAMIELLGEILKTGNSRWVRRALELLLRFASTHRQEAQRTVQDVDLGGIILRDVSKLTQARELYFRFLTVNAADDAEWTLSELARFLSDAIKRQSEGTSVEVLSVATVAAAFNPKLVRRLEALSRLDSPAIASRITSIEVARKMGDLYFNCWRSEAISVESAVDEIRGKKGLAMLGRLHALSTMILEGTSSVAARAFELTGGIEDGTTRVMAARTTWAGCLPIVMDQWPTEEINTLMRNCRRLAGDVLGPKRNGYADILYHVVRYGPFSERLARHLLGDRALNDILPWLDTRVLGHRLIQGVAEGIAGARSAFDLLTASPEKHELLARGALAQIKTSPGSSETQAIALRIAVATKHSEAALDALRRLQVLGRRETSLIRSMYEMAERLWRTGNPKSMRIGAGLIFELVRLEARASPGWDEIVAEIVSEKDDLSVAQLVRALNLLTKREPAETETRARWLLDFAKNRGPSIREAVLVLFSDIASDYPNITSGVVEELFDLAFTEPTDGSIIDWLQVPLFTIYRNRDPRAITLGMSLVERSAHLSTQTCHRVCGTFRRLFGLIVERMDLQAANEILARVPGMQRRLARMILEGVARRGGDDLAERLKAVAEDPSTDPEISTLAARFLVREFRVAGVKQWPELYELVPKFGWN